MHEISNTSVMLQAVENRLMDRIVSITDRSDELFTRALIIFTNGYGVSVVRGPYSYGGNQGLFEVAVTNAHGELCENPVTDDVLGYLDRDEVALAAAEVAALPR